MKDSNIIMPDFLADEVARRMMTEILASRRFQRYWIEELQQVMEIEQQINQQHNSYGYLTIKQMELEEIEQALQQLVDGLQLAVETFLRSCK
jgi:hypothetical protein